MRETREGGNTYSLSLSHLGQDLVLLFTRLAYAIFKIGDYGRVCSDVFSSFIIYAVVIERIFTDQTFVRVWSTAITNLVKKLLKTGIVSRWPERGAKDKNKVIISHTIINEAIIHALYIILYMYNGYYVLTYLPPSSGKCKTYTCRSTWRFLGVWCYNCSHRSPCRMSFYDISCHS